MPRFSVGDRVLQAQYGVGTITELNEYHTVIDFDEHGVKRFSTPMVQLEPSNLAAPPKRAKSTRRKSPARS
jgi:hypothetical protein